MGTEMATEGLFVIAARFLIGYGFSFAIFSMINLRIKQKIWEREKQVTDS